MAKFLEMFGGGGGKKKKEKEPESRAKKKPGDKHHKSGRDPKKKRAHPTVNKLPTSHEPGGGQTTTMMTTTMTTTTTTTTMGSKDTIPLSMAPPVDNGTTFPMEQPKLGASKEVIKWVHRALDMGVVALQEEYRGLAKYTMPDMTIEAFRANHEAGKNRYQDVPCQDQNRVVLKWPGCPIDYVHANYVATPHGPKRFICTQGPLDCTIMEFWTMVVQEESTIIVMLCNVIECGKLKCAQYWPENKGETKKIEGVDFEIINEGASLHPVEPTVRKTMLLVKYKDPQGVDQQRSITHYQWLDWPDRGVPPCRLTSMELLSCVRGSKKPIVVHCSAGIGRTGTIVAIEYIMERLVAGQECAAMNELLKMLRDQRAWTIQNDLQYLYIHRIMLAYFLEKHKARYANVLEDGYTEKYAQFIVDYDQVTGASKPQ